MSCLLESGSSVPVFMTGRRRGPCPQLVPMNPMPGRRGGWDGVGVGWGTGRALFSLRLWFFFSPALLLPEQIQIDLEPSPPPVPQPQFPGPLCPSLHAFDFIPRSPFPVFVCLCVCTCVCMRVCLHPWRWAPCQPVHSHLQCLLQPPLFLLATFNPQSPCTPAPHPRP